jgi:hypothetical protein
MIKLARSFGGSKVDRSSRSAPVAFLAGLLTIVLLSCQASPAPSARLHIDNIDGPTAKVVIDGVLVATVACGQSTTAALPGHAPWQVAVIDAAGTELLRQNLAYASDQELLIRADGVETGSWPAQGGPAPLATCPPG